MTINEILAFFDIKKNIRYYSIKQDGATIDNNFDEDPTKDEAIESLREALANLPVSKTPYAVTMKSDPKARDTASIQKYFDNYSQPLKSNEAVSAGIDIEKIKADAYKEAVKHITETSWKEQVTITLEEILGSIEAIKKDTAIIVKYINDNKKEKPNTSDEMLKTVKGGFDMLNLIKQNKLTKTI